MRVSAITEKTAKNCIGGMIVSGRNNPMVDLIYQSSFVPVKNTLIATRAVKVYEVIML